MSLTRILSTLALVSGMAAPVVISAQVPVEVSSEKVVSGGKAYYMHEVQKSQTLYSISRAYRVTIDAITRENVIPPNGIQTGQVLRIPVTDQQAAALTQNRTVARQANDASQPISAGQPPRPAPVSGVPGISISNEKIVSGGKTYYMHEVLKGQTLYSLAKAYKVTILDIDRENSIPPGGIQAGQVLKIPASSALTFIEEHNQPSEQAARPGVSTAAREQASTRDQAAAGNALPRQETVRQETQMPRQETQMPRQETQMPRQEQAEVKTETKKVADEGTVAFKANETKEDAGVKPQPENTQQEAAAQQVQQETPPAVKSEDKPKPVQPEKKKIHKVQKGESLADIANKYGITVQELKSANKGVIFAMPDMRLVIPVNDEDDSRK